MELPNKPWTRPALAALKRSTGQCEQIDVIEATSNRILDSILVGQFPSYQHGIALVRLYDVDNYPRAIYVWLSGTVEEAQYEAQQRFDRFCSKGGLRYQFHAVVEVKKDYGEEP